MMFTPEEALALLNAAGVFFDDEEGGLRPHTLNLNDTFAWGTPDGELVPDEELPVVAELFLRYGWCGVLCWVSERRDGERSEFPDTNRQIEFVRTEERLRIQRVAKNGSD